MSMVYAMLTCLSCFGKIRTEIIDDLSTRYKAILSFFFVKETISFVFIDERFDVLSIFHSDLSICLYHNQPIR